jgi:hypothetical protein
VSVLITDFGGSTITVNTTATVTDSPLTGFPLSITATAGVPLMSVPLAIFVDGGGAETLSNYTATIDWGDGGHQTVGVSLINSIFLQVAGAHTYFQAGPLTATVTLFDEGDSMGSVLVPVTVNPGPADHFLISAPGSVSSGTPFDVTVAVQDAFNNTVPGYDRIIMFGTSDMDSGVVLPSNYAFDPNGDQGVHFFDHTQGQGVTLITAGVQTLTVTDIISGISGSTSITVTTGPGSSGGGQSPARTGAFGLALDGGRPVSEGTAASLGAVSPVAAAAPGNLSSSPRVADLVEPGATARTLTPASRQKLGTVRPILSPAMKATVDDFFATVDRFDLVGLG